MKGKEIVIKLHTIELAGEIIIPEHPKGLVIFSHGSGSSRFSPRNKYVADVLNKNHFATLLFDLLTEDEDRVYGNRFNINLLTERLAAVTRQMAGYPGVKGLPIGYFGASTGAASALMAASLLGDMVKTVVSRGGRPDLALDILPGLKASVLLIVGGQDFQVIEMNETAYKAIRSVKDMKIIPGATHLFEEPGKLEQVAELAAQWYKQHLGKTVAITT